MFLEQFVNTYEFKVHATSSWYAALSIDWMHAVWQIKLHLSHASLQRRVLQGLVNNHYNKPGDNDPAEDERDDGNDERGHRSIAQSFSLENQPKSMKFNERLK